MFENLINNFREDIENIFSQNGINAPVTPHNLKNAVIAVPKVKSDLAAKFDGFDGFDDFDNATGKKLTPEQKKERRQKIKEKIVKGIDTVKAIKSGGEPLPPIEQSEQPKSSKILGLDKTVFWVSLVIFLLILTLILVKVLKK